jgi:Uma2 family endonuclease
MALTVKEFFDKVEHEPALHHSLETFLKAMRIPGPLPLRMSYDDFLAWADEDTLAEWDNGEVIMASPASDRHQDLEGFLLVVLRVFVECKQLGYVRDAPFQMKLASSGREPDILFVSQAHRDRLKATHLDGPADLVIEIISLESIERDRGTKFVEYEAAGIPEYWLIDPLRNWAEFYRLDENGCYNPAFSGRHGVYASPLLPGFDLRVDWLWQQPLPPVLDVLRELRLIDQT